jgi:hypothetical protein
MQGFSGLILFSVFLLMALGLAIIFGQMGVINMAHGEFMILGAYMTYLCVARRGYAPGLFVAYFFIAIVVAFIVSARSACSWSGPDPLSLQAAARHAARHLGPQPHHAAGLPLRLRRRAKSASRCPTG